MTRARAVMAALALVVTTPTGAAAQDVFAEVARALLEGRPGAVARATALAGDGDTRAYKLLAAAHLEGVGVARDARAAMGWFCRLAHDAPADEDVLRGVWLLGEYFRTGGGIASRAYAGARRGHEDPLRAYFFYQLLARQSEVFGAVDRGAARLGSIGAGSVGRELYDEERESAARAALGWRDAPAPASGEDCLDSAAPARD